MAAGHGSHWRRRRRRRRKWNKPHSDGLGCAIGYNTRRLIGEARPAGRLGEPWLEAPKSYKGDACAQAGAFRSKQFNSKRRDGVPGAQLAQACGSASSTSGCQQRALLRRDRHRLLPVPVLLADHLLTTRLSSSPSLPPLIRAPSAQETERWAPWQRSSGISDPKTPKTQLCSLVSALLDSCVAVWRPCDLQRALAWHAMFQMQLAVSCASPGVLAATAAPPPPPTRTALALPPWRCHRCVDWRRAGGTGKDGAVCRHRAQDGREL